VSKFFVGQRVRIVGPTTSIPRGSTATIVCIELANHVRHGRGVYNDVDVDGYGRLSRRGWQLAFRDEDLEPLVPPHEPCEAEFKASLDKLLEGLPA
jgi:hypothetical protein